jgi:hypothetical protein
VADVREQGAPGKDPTVKILGRLMFALFFALSVAGLLYVGLGTDLTSGAPKEPTKENPTTNAEQTADKPKEPVNKEDPAKGTARLDVKAISLKEAIDIAEKLGKGQAVKAERKDKPEVCFKIDVVGPDGTKKIELTADGKVKEKKPDEEKKPEEKKPNDRKPTEKKPAEKKPENKG